MTQLSNNKAYDVYIGHFTCTHMYTLVKKYVRNMYTLIKLIINKIKIKRVHVNSTCTQICTHYFIEYYIFMSKRVHDVHVSINIYFKRVNVSKQTVLWFFMISNKNIKL